MPVGVAGAPAAAAGLVSYAAARAAAYLARDGADAQTVRAVAELRYACSSYGDVGLAILAIKDTDDTEILTAAHAAHSGQAIFDPTVAPLLAGLIGPAARSAARLRSFRRHG